MRLTRQYLEEQVKAVDYTYNGQFTICTITTVSGTKLVGTSGVLDPANYDKQIGEVVAHENAVNQLWQLEGYFFQKLGLGALPVDPSKVKITETVADNAVHVVLVACEK